MDFILKAVGGVLNALALTARRQNAVSAAGTLSFTCANQGFRATEGIPASGSIGTDVSADGCFSTGSSTARASWQRTGRVIATASTRNKAFVLGLGADQFVDDQERPFEEQVGDVDAVLDTVGGDTLPRSFGVVKRGWLVSIVTQPSPEQAEEHGVHAAWIWVVPSRPDLDHLTSLVESGQLKPHVTQTFPLERVADAHRAQETGRTVGKIVLIVERPTTDSVSSGD